MAGGDNRATMEWSPSIHHTLKQYWKEAESDKWLILKRHLTLRAAN